MQSVLHRLAKGIAILRRIHFGPGEDMIQAPRGLQARERTQPRYAVLVSIFV